jgi:hypothetical protein
VELTSTEEHGEFYEDSGEWLPLAVWATRGFDAELIRTKSRPEDRKEHGVLGEIFRVSVLGSGHKGANTVTKQDKLSVTAAPSSSSSSPLPGNSAVLAITDKSASSSSPSSSSSSSRHKKNKSKKDKKAKHDKKTKKDKKDKKRSRDEDKVSVSSSAFCWWLWPF